MLYHLQVPVACPGLRDATENRAGKLRAFMPGRNRRSFLGVLGGGACIRHSFLVAIAIVAVNGPTMAMVDALLPALLRFDVERTSGPRQHPPDVGSRIFPSCHHGPH